MFKMSKRKNRNPKSMKTFISHEMHIHRRNIYVGTPPLELVNEKNFHEFLVMDNTDEDKRIECACEYDHFALYLLASAKKYFIEKYKKNAAVGLIWCAGTAGQHDRAFNFIVNEELKIRYFEPQNGQEIFPLGRKLFIYI